ncbi:MAG: hypothetical protein AAFQ79_05635 [Pseudomonadota bacterium]
MTIHRLKCDGAKLTVYLDGPEWDGAATAAIGEFSCKEAEAGSALLAQALNLVRDAGRTRVIGPMAGDTWHSYRFVSDSDGSPPFLLEPTNKPHEPGVFHAAGFHPISRYFSARVSLDGPVTPDAPTSSNLTVTPWDGTDPDTLFRQVYALSVDAFSNNAFYKPITEDAFLEMYRPVVPMMRPELVFFARRPDGSLAGFLFAIPNYAEGPKTQTVILKTYASLERGAGRLLVAACNDTARALGFRQMIHALIHDDNQSAQRSAAEGAEIFRRYELLGLGLDG